MNVRNVTAEELEVAAIAEGIYYVPHHQCSMCNVELFYRLVPVSETAREVMWHGTCSCSSEPESSRTWQSIADWVNLQSQSVHKIAIAKRFGLDIAPKTA